MTFHGLTRCGVVASVLALCCFVSVGAYAGDAEDYSVYFRVGDDTSGDAEVDPGDTIDIDIMWDADGSVDIQGYQWGICMDEDTMDIGDDDIAFSDLLTTDDFTFESRTVLDGGWTVGALLNVITEVTIEAVDDTHIYTCTYTSLEDGTYPTTIEYCESLGTPPVTVRIVTVNSTEVPVEESDLEIAELKVPIFTEFRVDDAATHVVKFNAGGATTEAAEVPILLLNQEETNGTVGAFSFGISHDGTKLELSDINIVGTDTDTFDPEYLATNTSPAGGDGGTIACVLSLELGDFDGFDVDETGSYHIANFVYNAGDDLGDAEETDLTFTADLGSPAVAIVMSVEGVTLGNVTTAGGTVVGEIGKGEPTSLMLRGDMDDSGAHDLSDITALLEFAFQNGDDPLCRRAADFDDDGSIGVSDVLGWFNWIFLDGEDPAGGPPECTETLQNETDKETCLDDQLSC